MHNPTQKTTSINLAGREYKLVFDFDAIAEAEDLLDRPILSGLTKREFDHPRINLVRGFFFAAALKHQPDLTYEQAKALVTPQAMPSIWAECLGAWAASMAKPEEHDEANPQQGRS